MAKVSNTCDKTALPGVRFVDESAIEIDIADDDDDDVSEAKKKRLDCANNLSSFRHYRGDESVDNELTAQVGLQFETTVSDKAVENETTLSRHDVMSQPCSLEETWPRLSLHGPDKDGSGDKGKLQKVQSDSDATKAYLVDESAVEIDVADDDSSDSVVIIEDDSDNDGNSRRSKDILNLAEDAAGSWDNVVSDLQENVTSKQRSKMTTSRWSSSGVAAASVKKLKPVIPRSRTVRRSRTMTTPTSNDEVLLSEYNLQHLKTISSSDSAMDPEILYDEFDLEHLQKPFSCGWRRELVCRRPGWKSKGRMCDVYYFSPEGIKLRSRIELNAFLLSNTDSTVNLTHFTFKRVLLFNPPFEIVRLARNLKKLTGQSNSPENKAQLKNCSSGENIATEKTSTEQSATKNVAVDSSSSDSAMVPEIVFDEINLEHLQKPFSCDSAMVPEIVFDEINLEHLQKPFSCGWRRELVCRRPGWTNKGPLCDVYYFSPEGIKLRSRVDLAAYLLSNMDSTVNLTHFTFKRVLLFNPPFEIVRLARSKSFKTLTGHSNSPDNKAQLKNCSSGENIAMKQTSTGQSSATKNVVVVSSSSGNAESCVVRKDVAGRKINLLTNYLLHC